MYIQITTRCQMSCAHCCYACTTQGEDMSLATFRHALEYCAAHSDIPCIGGGEPTLHPHFEKMLLEAIASDTSGCKVSIVTNGGVKRRALMLASLAAQDIIYAQLSQDEYHDPIDMEVIYAFEKIKYGIRDTSQNGTRDPLPHGRAKDLVQLEPTEENCCCPEHTVKPDGTVYQCGCDDSPMLGHITDDDLELLVHGQCWRSEEYRHYYS